MKILSTYIYILLLKTKSKLIESILLKIRKLILIFTNPIIKLEFRGFSLSMPLSHTIFYYQKLYPNYDMGLHKIAKFIEQKDGFLNIIDIGANIGDTVVFTSVYKANYLLIEGEESYLNLIENNLASNYGGGYYVYA